MAKPLEKLEARKRRKNGESIKSIAHSLHVSPSTVSVWCRDVILTQEQISRLQKQSKDPLYGNRLRYALRQKNQRIEKTKKLRKMGVKEVGTLTKRELFLIGIALYWAEGFKKDSQAGFSNSDPKMINIFLQWLYVCFGYTHKDLSLRITVNNSHSDRISQITNYWSSITGIPKDQFQMPYFQKVKWIKQYENPETYFGVLRIKVKKSTDFLRKIHGYIDGLGAQKLTSNK